MRTALIVDDDSNVTQTLRLWLESVEYDVEVAETGQKALELFKPGRFDAVILDLHLPDVSGKFVYDNLKENQVVVVMSGDPLLLEDFPLKIAKPFRPKELLNFLEEVL